MTKKKTDVVVDGIINLGYHSIPLTRIVEAKKTFIVGEEVYYGNLHNCIVTKVWGDGRLYSLEVDVPYTKTEELNRVERIAYWFDLYKMDTPNQLDAAKLVEQKCYLTYKQVRSIDLDSLHRMSIGCGFVMNNEYQRDYVWKDAEKVSLIDSIFKGLGIGSVSCITHEFPNTTIEVIDGQQRITTILDFMQDGFSYKGKFWSDLTFRDRGFFSNTHITQETHEAKYLKKSDILHMFLCANVAGVAQDESHLRMVEDKYNLALAKGE